MPIAQVGAKPSIGDMLNVLYQLKKIKITVDDQF
jgi:hypothetical protein